MIEGLMKRVFIGEVRHKLVAQILNRLKKGNFGHITRLKVKTG